MSDKNPVSTEEKLSGNIDWSRKYGRDTGFIKFQTRANLSLLETTNFLTSLNSMYMYLEALDDYVELKTLKYKKEHYKIAHDLRLSTMDLLDYMEYDSSSLVHLRCAVFWGRAGVNEPRTFFRLHRMNGLLVKSIHMNSPGVWEFIGKLNPLESLRTYLCEKHERKKDIEYRNRIDEDSRELDNDIKRFQIINSAIETMRKAGISDRRIQKTVLDQCKNALSNLNNDVITNIEYVELKEDRITDKNVKKPPE